MWPKSRRRQKKRNNNYIVILIVAVAAFIGGTAGITLAFLTSRSEVSNQFTKGEVSAQVNETFQNDLKEDVSVENTGTVPAYIRAVVRVNWQDGAGNILWGKPEESTDYTMTLNLASAGNAGWVLGLDGYYYYTEPVDAGQSTGVLIDICQEENINLHQQEGKFLVVDISAQSIQAEPSDAVLEAWASAVAGVDEDTGALQMRTGTTGTGGIDQGGRNAG